MLDFRIYEWDKIVTGATRNNKRLFLMQWTLVSILHPYFLQYRDVCTETAGEKKCTIHHS